MPAQKSKNERRKSTGRRRTKVSRRGAALHPLPKLPDPLVLEKALAHLTKTAHLHATQHLAPGFERLERRISESNATQDLDSLCTSCDKNELLWHLGLCADEAVVFLFEGLLDKGKVGSLEDLIGMDARQVQVAMSGLIAVAEKIESINSHAKFGLLLAYEPLQSFQVLPEMLRRYAVLLKQCQRDFGPKVHGYRNLAKALLTKYVKSTTGRYFDGKVSALIASVGGKSDYDETTHRRWRRKHYKRLSAIPL